MSTLTELAPLAPADLEGIENPYAFLVSRFGRRPAGFVREVLGVQPFEWQASALDALARGHRRISIRSGHGVGKLNPMTMLVPTPDGERLWGDLQPGDRLFGVTGEPVHITARFDQGVKPIYRVRFDDGTSCRCGAEHLWTVRGRAQRRVDGKRLYRKGVGRSESVSAYAPDFVTMTTDEIRARGVKRPNGAGLARQWEIPPQGPAQYPWRDVPIAPYLLGVWLGDGSASTSAQVNGSAEKAEHWAAYCEAAGVSFAIARDSRSDDRVALRLHGHMDGLRTLELVGLKSGRRFIPQSYLENAPAVRMAVLQGLMDADGYIDERGVAVYTSVSKQLAADVAWLVRSLGGKAFVGSARPSSYRRDGERVAAQDHYDVTVRLPQGMSLFTLPYKAARERPCEPRYLTRWIEAIEPDGEEQAMCVTVDAPDGLYLANDFIVTHNTAFLSWVMLWHLLTRFPQKCVCTAPSAPQLYDALWAELRTWIFKLPSAWQQLLEPTSDRVELRAAGEQSFISARTSRAEAPEAMAGVHSTWVLLIVDEASGVPEAVFESATGSMSTPGAITILTGNPTRSTGFFHRTHTMEADRWWTLRVASDECPHVDRRFIEDVAVRYGRSSNAWRVRIMGEFPIADSDTLIGAEMVEQAMERMVAPDFTVPEIWGVDVARFGTDLSVLMKRRGNLVVDQPRSWAGLDLMALTGQIVNEWNKTGPAMRPECIVIDDIGLGGGVTDRLKELLPCAIQAANVGEAPSVEGRFRRMRDELWGKCADWLATRAVSLPTHERLRDDLVAPKYRFLSDGKLVVESKAEMKGRRLPSPDFADALCLTFAPGAATALAFKQLRWNKPIKRWIRGIV